MKVSYGISVLITGLAKKSNRALIKNILWFYENVRFLVFSGIGKQFGGIYCFFYLSILFFLSYYFGNVKPVK